MRRMWQAGIIALIAVMAAPGSGLAQRDDVARWLLFSSWSVEVHGGFSDYGRFLLQALDSPDGIVAQRELEADNAFSLGLAFGTTILPRTGLRLAFTHTFSTDLNYRDDTGIGTDLFDIDGIASLSNSVLSLEVIRFVLPERIRLTPYGAGGVAVGWWNLSDQDLLIIAGDGDDTQVRWGAVGAIGLQYRARNNIVARLEATTYGMGNPFTGNESFVPTTGFTIDEPTRVRQTMIRLGIAYRFGRFDR